MNNIVDLEDIKKRNPDITNQLEKKSEIVKIPQYTFEKFSLSGSSKIMEQQTLEDIEVLQGLALLGQSTLFYAGPNLGKTLIILWLLVKSIKKGNFDPKNLFYINADDDYKGLIQKIKIAEYYGFHMASPGHKGFRSTDLFKMMRECILNDTARNKIIILDTLKKFTNLMDKDDGSNAANIIREFISKGGTVISLAHTNKHKGVDGKSIHAGTSDMKDDSDCAYTADVVAETEDEKVIEFTNNKSRGNVKNKLSFSYKTNTTNYMDLFNSVKIIDSADSDHLKQKHDRDIFKKENIIIINYIKELIFNEVKSQKEIIHLVSETHGVGRNKTLQILNQLKGDDPVSGYIWSYKSRLNNRYEYQLLQKYEDLINEYN